MVSHRKVDSRRPRIVVLALLGALCVPLGSADAQFRVPELQVVAPRIDLPRVIPRETVVSAPRLAGLDVEPPTLRRPAGDDQYRARLLIAYESDPRDPVSVIELREVDPRGVERVERFDAVALGLEGAKGVVELPVVFRSSHATGTYRYSLRLAGSTGEWGKPLEAGLSLTKSGAPSLAVTSISPSSGRPGDKVSIRGYPFDDEPEAMVVSFAGRRAELLDLSPSRLVVAVPADAFSGRVSVTTSRGQVWSAAEFHVARELAIEVRGSDVVEVLESRRLRVLASGLPGPEVRWFVEDDEGGSPKYGRIDESGNYLAPPVAPEAGEVRVRAVSLHDETVYAETVLGIVAPCAISGPGRVRASTGGRIESEDGRVAISIEPGILATDLELRRIEASPLESWAELGVEAERLAPLGVIGLETSEELREEVDAGIEVALPVWLPAGTRLELLEEHEGAYYPGSALRVDGTGVRATGRYSLREATARLAVAVDVSRLPNRPLITVKLDPRVDALPMDVEEGMTVPVSIRGRNFQPARMRVKVADPALAPYFQFGPVIVSAQRDHLGCTVYIKPMDFLAEGQVLDVPLRVELLFGSGGVFAYADTPPGDFPIHGLDELIVEADPCSELYTIDGERIDYALSDTQKRFSTIEVAGGATLGIGRAVDHQVQMGTATLSLANLDHFQMAFGPLEWLADVLDERADESCPSGWIRIFQPLRALARLDVTGPVTVRGKIYFSGMRGGQNPGLDQPRGPGLLGGLAGGSASGGAGGDGGRTNQNGPQDGNYAGNGISADGVGRWASGNPVNIPPAGFGSRFDRVSVSFNTLFNAAVQAVNPFSAGFKNIEGAAKFIHEANRLSSTSMIPNGPHKVAGEGGHGGQRQITDPILDETSQQILPGSGGGGGGGGGSTDYEETLFGVTLRAEKIVGGAGAGGGGAAGALRITASNVVQVSGRIAGDGGRGGFGEPHYSFGSPGGGGGGGTGGILKLQGHRVSTGGQVHLSGGQRAGAIVVDGTIQLPTGSNRRLQVLPGLQSGGILTYGRGVFAGTASNHVAALWPTGRLRWPATASGAPLSFLGGIRGIGAAPKYRLFSVDLSGLLVIDGAKRIRFTSSVDYFSSTPGILDVHLFADLGASSTFNGFTPTDVAQSPVFPYPIYVAGVRDTGSGVTSGSTARSEIHWFSRQGAYLGLKYSVDTTELYDTSGNIRELEILRNGRAVALMTTAGSTPQGGVHEIDLATGQRTLLVQGAHSGYRSMSVFRGDRDDKIYLLVDDDVVENGVQGEKVRVLDTQGNRISEFDLIHETISEPGQPGLLRVDGRMSGQAPTIEFDGFELPSYLYEGNPVTFRAPVIGSFQGPSASTPSFQSLVFGQPQLDVWGHGGQAGDVVDLKHRVPGAPATGTTAVVDANGNVKSSRTLDPGYNWVWLEHNSAGDTHELLRRLVLYIEDGDRLGGD